jgi:cold-inducible RNA-binding protein
MCAERRRAHALRIVAGPRNNSVRRGVAHCDDSTTRQGDVHGGAVYSRWRIRKMTAKIYVGNLPYTCDEQQLRDLFGSDGRNVADVAIITDRMTGQPRGFAFVNMVTADDAKRAIDALHGSVFGGRTLTVNEARPRENGGGGGGGGGYGGGGGGGRGGDRGGGSRY